jgi:hypothetical protein
MKGLNLSTQDFTATKYGKSYFKTLALQQFIFKMHYFNPLILKLIALIIFLKYTTLIQL